MRGRYRPPLDRIDQSRAMDCVQERRLARCLTVDQSVRPSGIELHYPVSNDLQRDATQARRLRPARTLVDRCQGQKASRLRAILRFARRSPYCDSVIVDLPR